MFILSFNFINKIRRKLFPFYRNKKLKKVFETLQQGYSEEKVVARFVGGCVRKYLLGEKIDDIDIATIFTTDQIKDKFKESKFKIIDSGLKYGTVTLLSDDIKLEITTLRKDLRSDGRHAEVEYINNWQLDSERRDFTINSIYLDIKGKIFDPQGGHEDLKKNKVKFIGDPQKRIEEDYLRVIRFLRFKIIHYMKIEKGIGDIIKQNLDGIKKISKERILIELLKILNLKNFLHINKNNDLKEIFELIFPEFLYLNRLERLKKLNKNIKINFEIILAITLIDEKNNHEYFAHKYNISNKLFNSLKAFATNLNKIKMSQDFLKKDLLKNIYINGKNHMLSLNIINFASNSRISVNDFNKILKAILSFKTPKNYFNGEFLKQNGMREGENLGIVLKIIEDEWIKNDFKINNDRVKEIIKANNN